MAHPLYTGALTRLTAFDPDRGGELYAKWYRDSEFSRNYDFLPVRPRSLKRSQERLGKQEAKLDANLVRFHIETLADNQIIGECELESDGDQHHDAWVAIGIGERAYWSRGYGSDALKQLLAFGFMEWNLNRISLSAFDYNLRAIRSYEKVGFQTEGRKRGHLQRDGRRQDTVYMGILRREWEAIYYG